MVFHNRKRRFDGATAGRYTAFMPASFSSRRYGFDWRGFITPGVKLVVLICSGVFLIQTLADILLGQQRAYHLITQTFGLIPDAIIHGLRIWQPFTYIFLHGGLFHLLINMLMLWMFGRELEQIWGKRKFLNYFFLCGVGAGLIEVVVKMVPVLFGKEASLDPHHRGLGSDLRHTDCQRDSVSRPADLADSAAGDDSDAALRGGDGGHRIFWHARQRRR